MSKVCIPLYKTIKQEPYLCFIITNLFGYSMAHVPAILTTILNVIEKNYAKFVPIYSITNGKLLGVLWGENIFGHVGAFQISQNVI